MLLDLQGIGIDYYICCRLCRCRWLPVLFAVYIFTQTDTHFKVRFLAKNLICIRILTFNTQDYFEVFYNLTAFNRTNVTSLLKVLQIKM